MATVKLKRGQESKVSSLPKEDGSLIFGYNTASVPATMQLDQSINGTVQRLNLSVANSSTSNYSKNSAALGSSSLSQILNYVNNKDIKVSQLTNQDLNTLKTPGFYYAPGGNTCTNKPSDIDAFGLEVIRTANEYYTQRLTLANINSNTIYTRYYNSSAWSAWTNTFNIKALTAYTADISKNANALSGSSLQNIIDKINTTSGSGNAFTGLDTTTNNVVKLTRVNGGTVQKTIDNVAHATSANNANLLDGIDSSRFPYGGNSAAVDSAYSNASSIWKSGFYDLNVSGGSANGLPTSNSWHWLIQAGHRNNSSGNRYGLQITAPNDTNGNLYFRTNPSSGAGTWKTIIDSHNYTSYAADRNAFTGLDTTTNNVIKLTRANGGTVQKTINNVANATSANISKEIYHYQQGNVAYATSDTHIMKYGYLKCDGSFQNLTLLITCAFWGNQHGSAHLINFQQDTNSNSAATVQYTGRVIRIGGNTDREFYAYKDNTNKRLYLYAKVTGGNSYGKWNVSVLQSSGGFSSWVSEFGVNQTLPSGYERIPYTYPGTADNSNALAGSSLQNIIDKINSTSGSGNAFTSIDTATNNIVKLTRANGGTVQKVIDNVSHASTSSYSYNSRLLQGCTITTESSGSSATFANKIVYANSYGVTELSRYIDFHGDATSRNYSLRLDSGTPSNLIITGPSASTVTAAYFNGNAKNSNALGGSSLSQILTQAGSGNAFTGLDTTTNNVIKLTRANGGTVQKTINNVSNASTSRFLRSTGVAQFASWTDSLTDKNSTGRSWYGFGTYTNSDTQTWLNISQYWGINITTRDHNHLRHNDSVILDASNYTSYAADKTAFTGLDTATNNVVKLTRANGTTIQKTINNVSNATSATISSTANIAKNSNALGGSSLSQILSSITSGSVIAETAIRLATTTKSVANNFTIRTGTPTSSGWTQHPAYHLYNTTDSDLTAYKGKSVSLLHMDGGAQRHDIVALNSANDGLLYATASSTDGSARIERILDGGNYGSLITNLSKQVTFSKGLKAQTNVQMDGGNFSTGSTVTTGNGETTIPNVHFSVSGKTLIITTK